MARRDRTVGEQGMARGIDAARPSAAGKGMLCSSGINSRISGSSTERVTRNGARAPARPRSSDAAPSPAASVTTSTAGRCTEPTSERRARRRPTPISDQSSRHQLEPASRAVMLERVSEQDWSRWY